MEQLTPFLSVSLAIVCLLLFGSNHARPSPPRFAEFYELNASTFREIQADKPKPRQLRNEIRSLMKLGKARELTLSLTSPRSFDSPTADFLFLGTLVAESKAGDQIKTIVVFSPHAS